MRVAKELLIVCVCAALLGGGAFAAGALVHEPERARVGARVGHPMRVVEGEGGVYYYLF